MSVAFISPHGVLPQLHVLFLLFFCQQFLWHFPYNYRSCADIGVIAKITALYPADSNSTAAPHIHTTYSCWV